MNHTRRLIISVIIILIFSILIIDCAREKIIIYKPLADDISLISPPDGDLVFVAIPQLIWHPGDGAVDYQLQVATSDVFRGIEIDTVISDTSFSADTQLSNGRYYWRVRARSVDNIWGDWSEASIRSFLINNNTDYIELAAIIQTPGTPQDVFVCDDIAYIADGHKLLTLIDVTDPEQPSLIGNIDREDGDYAHAVWKVPGDDIAYVADTDGKLMALDTSLPLDPYSMRSQIVGQAQNVRDLTGMVFQDTIYIFTVDVGFTNRHLNFYQIVYFEGIPQLGGDYRVPSIRLPSDGLGVFFDTLQVTVEYRQSDSVYYESQEGMFVFVAVEEAGLGWYDLSETHSFDGTDILLLRNPHELGWGDTPSLAQEICTKNGIAYVADDRGGLMIFDLPDTIPAYDNDSRYAADPVLISDINTSGRTKDLCIVGDYCFLADGSGGLKVIDIADPYAPSFIAAYDTEYAYGIWADDEYIYLADRDYGLMIFHNKL